MVQEFWRCRFLFPLQDLSVRSALNQWHPMRWRFTSSCVWASPASPTTVRHALLLFLHILLLNNWSLFSITIYSTTLLLFVCRCISLSFRSPFHSCLIPFWGWKESANRGWTPWSVSLSFSVLPWETKVIWHLSSIFPRFAFFLQHSYLQFQIICRLSNYSHFFPDFYSSHVWCYCSYYLNLHHT